MSHLESQTPAVVPDDRLLANHECMLGPDRTVVMAGFGPTTAGLILEVTRKMGKNAPMIIIVDRKDYQNEVGYSWEGCKGDAGLVTLPTWENIKSYDSDGVIELDDSSIRLSANQVGQESPLIAANMISELSFHLPVTVAGRVLDTSPTVKLPADHRLFAGFRHRTPQRLFRTGLTRNVGFNDALYELVMHNAKKAGTRVEYRRGEIRKVISGRESAEGDKKPALYLSGGERIEADLIVLGTGTQTGSIEIQRSDSDEFVDLPKPRRVMAAVREKVVDVERARGIYGRDCQRAHVFIPPGKEHLIHFAMLVPKRAVESDGHVKTVVTVAVIAREDELLGGIGVKNIVDGFISQYLEKYLPQGKNSNDDGKDNLVECEACLCQPSVPVSHLLVSDTYDHRVIGVGDWAAQLKLYKNGTGSGLRLGIMIGKMLEELGFSYEVLGQIAQKAHDEYFKDNRIGKETLKWFDETVVKDRWQATLVNLELKLESFLPYKFMHFLKCLEMLTTGETSYERIGEILFRGVRGRMVDIFSRTALGQEPPRW